MCLELSETIRTILPCPFIRQVTKNHLNKTNVHWLFFVKEKRQTGKSVQTKRLKRTEKIFVYVLGSKLVFRKVLENTPFKLTFWSHQVAISMVCLCLSPYKMASPINFSVYWRVKNPLFSESSNLSWATKADTLFRSISNPPRNPSGCFGNFLGFALILSLETNRVISA